MTKKSLLFDDGIRINIVVPACENCGRGQDDYFHTFRFHAIDRSYLGELYRRVTADAAHGRTENFLWGWPAGLDLGALAADMTDLISMLEHDPVTHIRQMAEDYGRDLEYQVLLMGLVRFRDDVRATKVGSAVCEL